MIDFDSPEVLNEHIYEMVAMPLRLLQVLLEASAEPAVCVVCGEALGPYPDDGNHHCALSDHEISEKVLHYCGKHCPNCNRKEDR